MVKTPYTIVARSSSIRTLYDPHITPCKDDHGSHYTFFQGSLNSVAYEDLTSTLRRRSRSLNREPTPSAVCAQVIQKNVWFLMSVFFYITMVVALEVDVAYGTVLERPPDVQNLFSQLSRLTVTLCS